MEAVKEVENLKCFLFYCQWSSEDIYVFHFSLLILKSTSSV